VEIIPVIDVMRGKVVHAQGGLREQYPDLQSILTASTQPLQVVRDLITFASFPRIYIADLDAIESGQFNFPLYRELSQQFPDCSFWTDAGVRTRDDCLGFAPYPNIVPIIGSETFVDAHCLADANFRQKCILSLDFKQGFFLGDETLLSQPKNWPNYIIAMNLDRISSQQGPDLTLLAELSSQSNSQIVAAGGVRDGNDLMQLKQLGIEQVLVASALHDGRIDKQYLQQLK